MEWFVKKEDGSSFGPIDVSELCDWASEGRIAPEDEISKDRQNWIPAHENLDLRMDWMIEFDGDASYGPIHLLAFADFVTEGLVGLDAGIKNIRHDVSYSLGEVLLPALVRSNSSLKAAIDELSAAADLPTPPPEPAAIAEAVDPLPTETPIPAELVEKPVAAIRDIAEQRKRAERWENLYKQEAEKTEEREAELNARVRELQLQTLELTTELDEVKSKLHNLEKMNSELEKIEALAESSDENKIDVIMADYKRLLDSHNHLSLQYDQLSNHFADQSKEIEDLREARSSIQTTADRRTRESLEEVQRERDEADKARSKLSILEKNYQDLLKSYREMNDQMIHLRQQVG